jgi:hypothetical protein
MMLPEAASLFLLGVVALILEKEYGSWAPAVATALLRVSARLVPRVARLRHLDEWLTDLETCREDGSTGLSHAFRVAFVSAPRVAWIEFKKQRVRLTEANQLERQVALQSGATRGSALRVRLRHLPKELILFLPVLGPHLLAVCRVVRRLAHQWSRRPDADYRRVPRPWDPPSRPALVSHPWPGRLLWEDPRNHACRDCGEPLPVLPRGIKVGGAYSREYRRLSAEYCLSRGLSVGKGARELGIARSTLGRWVQLYKETF